jgi:dTDP-4-amino-4,6-dideoxygalactose transaminase
MTSTAALQARLAAMFGRRFCVLTGNGTTAIWLALQVIKTRSGTGEVIVPAIACPSIPQAIQYAGFTPRHVDVRDDFTVDVDSMAAAITPHTRALLPVHIYGHACDMDAVLALARAHDLPVIEDAAQSIGGRFGDRLLGSSGDCGILSFGAGKILDAGGGGALLCDDEEAARAAEQLPDAPASPNVALETLSHWQLYHGTMNYLRVHPEAQVEAIWRRASPLFADLYLHAFPDALAPRIEEGLDALTTNLSERLRRAEQYHERLQDLDVVTTDAWRRSGAIWRYSFLAPSREDANRISAKLRAAGVNASNHYWSLADLFDGDKSLRATTLGSRVINFWVDERATDAAIDQAITTLR